MQGKPLMYLELKDFADADVLYDETTEEVYGIGGVSEQNGDNIVWFLGTEAIDRHPLKFVKFMKEELARQLEKYPKLINYAWKGNVVYLEWLRRMGADFGESYMGNYTKEQFIYFEFKKE